MNYFYDENGSPVALSYNNSATYYYYKNIFGDVLGILDSCGNVVVRYYYDAWGNIISTTGSMASTLGRDNPFRYRGYYYDTETGFYYLNARYYNPEWGRFISADIVLDTEKAIGCNLFAYCFNDPINYSDHNGNWPSWGQVFAAIATVAVAGAFAFAVVASAGAVGVAAGVAAASLGASGTVVGGAISFGVTATYAVGGGIAACGLSNAGEILTGTNVIRDGMMGGDQEAYNNVQTILNFVGGCAVQIGQANPGVSGRAAKPSQNAQTVHKIPTTGTPRTTFDKLYSGKPGCFQRTYYDFRGNISFQIDFTNHAAPDIHSNPHIHIWKTTGHGKQINLWYME